ncbi:MAG: hypothetical protein FWD62_13240 [Betaproteobacteria bacterium]|nr:hypothetical protein [Betaproteobacteria bacterium]
MNTRTALSCIVLLLGLIGRAEAMTPACEIETGQAPPEDTSLIAVFRNAADYVIYPLAPNWSLRETRIAEDRVRISLKLNRFHTGGEGEALAVLKRRADEIAQRCGYTRYEIASFEESITSGWIAQRGAEGEIVLAH